MPVLRVLLSILLAATLLGASPLAEAAYGDRCRRAGHDPTAEADLLRSTSNLRVYVHLTRLRTSLTLTRIAQQHAKALAARQRPGQVLWHTNIAPYVRNWAWLGQNVGVGPSVAWLQYAFLHSPGHRANMFYRHANRIGVGAWCDGGGSLWVAVDLMQAR
ncbi:MAG TPA: CAP domain-containing protein [Actinomycetes bacterium]